MVTVMFTDNCLVPFFNEQGKKEWYECDMFKGEKITYKDIVSANMQHIRFLCLDGETTLVPTMKCKVLSCFKAR